jgi:GNAT superfamily N-acetyltransferase
VFRPARWKISRPHCFSPGALPLSSADAVTAGGMSDPTARRLGAASWWQCVIRGSGSEPDRFVTVQSTRYPDGARVELAPDMARTQIGDAAVCVITFGEARRVARLELQPWFAPKAPPLWFAELRESTGAPPAVSLVAFTGAGAPAHALIDEAGLSNLPVRSRDQLGALRWYPATGEIDQIYVQPAWRRRNIASALLGAAASLSVARDWPRFWSDGQRTELGEDLRNGRSWRGRAAHLTHVAPPMTPDEAARLQAEGTAE